MNSKLSLFRFGINMERIDIIRFLRNEKEDLEKKFGVISIGLFGSFAKGNEQHESDIDLLVELSEPSFDSLAGLQLHLEKKLGKSVDLVRKRKGLSDRFLKRIERDIQYA